MPHSPKDAPRSGAAASKPQQRSSTPPPPPSQALKTLAEALEAILILEYGVVKISKLNKLFKLKDTTMLGQATEFLNTQFKNHGLVTRIEQLAETLELRPAAPLKNVYLQSYLHKKRKLPAPLMETLAIIAYNQPVTKSAIEHIRGTKSANTLKTLLASELIETSGYKDAPGKPLLYRTTTRFLTFFAVKSLRDLPPLKELKTYSFLN